MFPDYLLKAAKKLIPYLVRRARVSKTISRAELSSLVEMSPGLQLPGALDAVRQAICSPRGMPDLTQVVVDTPETQPAPAEYDLVIAYPDWDRLFSELGIAALETQPEDLEEEGYAYTNFLARHPTEENETWATIDFVAENPQVLGLRTWRTGAVNHPFLTGDTCDVLFDRDGLPVIAAAATRHRGSQVRGIYRLIKQRALLEAEKGRGEPLAVQCFLTAPVFPEDIRVYAARFQVNCVEISSDK